jgi:hypothetical protein
MYNFAFSPDETDLGSQVFSYSQREREREREREGERGGVAGTETVDNI